MGVAVRLASCLKRIGGRPWFRTAAKRTERSPTKDSRLPRNGSRAAAIGVAPSSPALLQRGLHRAEGRVQVCADALHDGDDRHRDAGRDETIFDGGRARLVTKKPDELRHLPTPSLRCTAWSTVAVWPPHRVISN